MLRILLTEARKNLVPDYETYYALLMNNAIVFLSEGFIYIDSIPLNSLRTWRRLRIKL